nr:DUF3102 domain-containing protein [Clostridiales bacterium]
KIVEVGRCLLAAKEQKLVPHGQWEAWVTKTTGMNERQAQRWMQIAREVPEGSYLSRLEVGKMRMILALPEEQREPLARKTVEQDIDTRTLKAEIRRLKGEVEQAQAETRIAKGYAEHSDQRVRELEVKLDRAVRSSTGGISAEAQKEIDRLRLQLEDAKTLAKVQAEKRQKAQQELLELRQRSADRDDGRPGLTSSEFLNAARQFILTAGLMPHMGAELARASAREREAWRQGLELVEGWAKAARSALSTVEGTVEA